MLENQIDNSVTDDLAELQVWRANWRKYVGRCIRWKDDVSLPKLPSSAAAAWTCVELNNGFYFITDLGEKVVSITPYIDPENYDSDYGWQWIKE